MQVGIEVFETIEVVFLASPLYESKLMDLRLSICHFLPRRPRTVLDRSRRRAIPLFASVACLPHLLFLLPHLVLLSSLHTSLLYRADSPRIVMEVAAA